MNWLSWNVRGYSKDGFLISALFLNIRTLSLDLFCILVTKIDADSASNLSTKLPFDKFECIFSVGQSGGILLCWFSDKLNVNVLFKHDRYLHCLITDLISQKNFYVTFLYMYAHKNQQLALWNDLNNLRPSNDEPWSLVGDFNCILTLYI